jgi:hypothetical protein
MQNREECIRDRKKSYASERIMQAKKKRMHKRTDEMTGMHDPCGAQSERTPSCSFPVSCHTMQCKMQYTLLCPVFG